ncbi:hypothetical protein Bhyg_14729 [Pseudolycoriella hygida]|uniref:Uncharacterized protein n=1 Tax=Pseudolycoriella hygida TaxID=35572 RepID=A0A9Q0MTN7_9DIPT|nr:hypothetical protein Bhyg_14729 [Pseudolycoriella hygida]
MMSSSDIKQCSNDTVKQIIFAISVVLCVTGKLSANPLTIINMKIGATPADAFKYDVYAPPNTLRFTRSSAVPAGESKIMRIIDVQQTPKMLGNERGARLHIASGAYPVYYSIARANGQFGKHIYALEVNE